MESGRENEKKKRKKFYQSSQIVSNARKYSVRFPGIYLVHLDCYVIIIHIFRILFHFDCYVFISLTFKVLFDSIVSLISHEFSGFYFIGFLR